jgi:uncharacterized protein (TIGR02996 family)
MTTADALLAAVIASPDDDLPRLVYADHLEEAGEETRAEFIRLQCAPAALRIRERVLRDAHAADWLAPLRRPGEPLFTRRSHAAFRRGFVEVVWLPAREFVKHADRLFDLTPVRELRVLLDTRAESRLFWMCEQLSRLRELHVSDCHFGELGASVRRAGHRLRGLKVLRLAACNLNDRDAELLCKAPLLLELLDLRHNPLSEQARERLFARFGDAVRFE